MVLFRVCTIFQRARLVGVYKCCAPGDQVRPSATVHLAPPGEADLSAAGTGAVTDIRVPKTGRGVDTGQLLEQLRI